jgi:hypothetical protein
MADVAPVERTLRPDASPTSTEMKVDLPVPLRPTRPTFSPAPTTNEASREQGAVTDFDGEG